MKDKKPKKIYNKQLVGVGVKKSRGIHTIFDIGKKQHELYRDLLLDSLEIPLNPRVKFYIFHFLKIFPWPLRGYLEASVCLLGKHSSGIEGWYPITMPVTGTLALWTGLKVGYPKYKPQSLTLKSQNGNWIGKVLNDDRAQFTLKFSPEDVDIPWRGILTTYTPFLLNSKLSGKINLMKPSVHKEKLYKEETGIVSVTIDSDEPWTNLFNTNELKAPGIFFQREGKKYLTRDQRKPI